jgi:hypothetical protein
MQRRDKRDEQQRQRIDPQLHIQGWSGVAVSYFIPTCGVDREGVHSAPDVGNCH